MTPSTLGGVAIAAGVALSLLAGCPGDDGPAGTGATGGTGGLGSGGSAGSAGAAAATRRRAHSDALDVHPRRRS
ncbi:MAG: hypothetical protein KF718_14235 [Polyangiaceae bacterium]|nr:hypothetical protein [Polyangiaceae bacterium]